MNYSLEQVLPDITPGKVLRGAPGLAGMTQVQLAEQVGVHKTNISEMERDRRAIGKDLARRLHPRPNTRRSQAPCRRPSRGRRAVVVDGQEAHGEPAGTGAHGAA